MISRFAPLLTEPGGTLISPTGIFVSSGESEDHHWAALTANIYTLTIVVP